MKKVKRRKVPVLLSVFLILGCMSGAYGQIMLDDQGVPGGTNGYGDLVMTANDDGSSGQLTLPFGLNFYGTTYNTFFVNNNGNVSFASPLSQYTPEPFPIANQPMIAPYWGDVDTRAVGEVRVASPNEDTAVVTWDNVGYYPSASNLTNDFQLVLRDRSDVAPGDFDFEFRYDQLEWTTGDASDGSGGLGGTEAQAGYDAGDGINFLSLPGSQTPAVLDLATTSNTGTDGLWSFAVRNGTPPGASPDNPFMPVVVDTGWDFDFNVGDTTTRVWIDPLVAVGYDYIVNSGANFSSVTLPTFSSGDNLYDLWLWNSGAWVNSSVVIAGGSQYDFGAGGLDRFRILGVEASLGLDPLDTAAFVTGLTFAGTGAVSMSQNPISFDTEPVPVPSSVLIAGIGLAFSSWRLKRKKN